MSAHDEKVRSLALELEGKSYEVRADIPGYDKPLNIEGYVPDIRAERGNFDSVQPSVHS